MVVASATFGVRRNVVKRGINPATRYWYHHCTSFMPANSGVAGLSTSSIYAGKVLAVDTILEFGEISTVYVARKSV